MEENRTKTNENKIEGRNAVLEAFRSGKPVDKLYVLDGCQDGPVRTIIREARKHDTLIQFVEKERLSQLSETGHHQGVIAFTAAYEYSEVSDMLELARKKGEDPFLILLDNIEDPHNLGAIIRTANLAGRTRCHHPQTKSRRTDSHRRQNLRRCAELHSGCQGNQFKENHGGLKKGRSLVRMCRYGRGKDVRSESDRTDRTGDWK